MALLRALDGLFSACWLGCSALCSVLVCGL